MPGFQDQLAVKLTWDFLAPNKAHNKADSAAAYLKGSITRHVKNFYLLSQVTHLAFACSRLRNTYLIEATFQDFPQVETAVPEDSFMRDAFSFQYRPYSYQTIKCKHKCKKSNHRCCISPPTCKVAEITIFKRDGTTEVQKLIGKDIENTNFQPLEENSFWASQDRQAVLKPLTPVRFSQTQLDENFDYDVFHDDPSFLSDDEYVDS